MAERDNEREQEELNAFILWMLAWWAAWDQYRLWIDNSWDWRIRRFKEKRRDARIKLVDNIEGLEFDKYGRARADTVKARNKIDTFRKRTDRVLGDLLVNSRHLMGMRGKLNKETGIWSGRMTKPLNEQAMRNLAQFQERVKKAAERSKSAEIQSMATPLDVFISQAAELAGDAGRQLAENIAANLTASVRQPRNKLEEAPRERRTKAEIADASSMELQPSHERNLEASFKQHLRALCREAADRFATEIGARSFMGIGPDRTKNPVLFKFSEYRAQKGNSLGAHPHDERLWLPVAPAQQQQAEQVVEIVDLKREKQLVEDALRVERLPE